ncbi:hypothetical protein J437_LFUL011836 [Ladona fulva]|uniref:Cytochrome P450 302A1 n=1 Tax=Ladona fulva TaxID=123851 RepID=A0A8K0K8N0_LADFU|nr:hypothetical protein J437_LFUL011836 [Ladona fulva]
MSDLTDNPMKERPFESMPGPKSFPFIGTLWNYLPLIGKYRMDRLHRNGALKLAEFGSVVREEIVPGTVIVWLFDPVDVEQLFRVEGRFPCRRSHLAIEKYRMDRPNIYKSGGLLPTNGPEWWRLRSAFQRDLSRVSSVRAYLPNTNTVLKEFIHHIEDDYMKSVKGDSTDRKPRDFLQSLSSLFLELTCLVAFDEKLGSLSISNSAGDSLPNQLIKAALDTNSCILSTDNGPQIWRYMETPLYKKLRKSQDIMERAAVKFVMSKKAKMAKKITSEQKSLLEIYLSSPDLDEKDVIGMAMDMLLAGVDTVYNLHILLLPTFYINEDWSTWLLSGNDECCPIITDEVLSQANYTKAVLKESLRLNPVSVGVGRILPCDTVFSGYSVPKGTVVVTQNQVSCRLEKYFKEPNKFLPERWIRGSDHHQKPTSPYLLLPFGHGPRTCIARRLAEQNIQALLLRVARDFKVIWMGKPDLDCVSLLINKPDQPLLFKFNRRAV